MAVLLIQRSFLWQHNKRTDPRAHQGNRLLYGEKIYIKSQDTIEEDGKNVCYAQELS